MGCGNSRRQDASKGRQQKGISRGSSLQSHTRVPPSSGQASPRPMPSLGQSSAQVPSVFALPPSMVESPRGHHSVDQTSQSPTRDSTSSAQMSRPSSQSHSSPGQPSLSSSSSEPLFPMSIESGSSSAAPSSSSSSSSESLLRRASPRMQSPALRVFQPQSRASSISNDSRRAHQVLASLSRQQSADARND